MSFNGLTRSHATHARAAQQQRAQIDMQRTMFLSRSHIDFLPARIEGKRQVVIASTEKEREKKRGERKRETCLSLS